MTEYGALINQLSSDDKVKFRKFENLCENLYRKKGLFG